MYQKNHFIVIIPARGGSKGIPKKNIVDLAGRPLIAWSIEAALNSKYTDEVIVSTDDQEIADISIKYGAKVPFFRPVEFAQDNSPATDPVNHFLEWSLKEYDQYPENIILIQPTSPLRTSADIDNAIVKFVTSNASSLISVCEPSQHPSDCILFSEKTGLERIELSRDEKIPGRQGYKPVYFIDGAIYITSTKRYLDKGTMFDNDSQIIILPKSHCIDIDSDYELELARAICFYSQNINSSFLNL
jgi:CMP-N,N'-diacetyllegionaminic acid synthase